MIEEQKHLTEKKEIENTLNLIARDSELSGKFSMLLKEAMVKYSSGRLSGRYACGLSRP